MKENDLTQGWKATTSHRHTQRTGLRPPRRDNGHQPHTETTGTNLADGKNSTDLTPQRQAPTIYRDETTLGKNERHSRTEENPNPKEHLEKISMMLVRLGKILMRILVILAGEVAGNRRWERDDVAGCYERRVRGGIAGLGKERKERVHLKQSIN